MKNIKSLLIILVAMLLGFSMEANATDYCGVSYSVSSPVACTVHVAFYKEGTTYVTQIEVEGNHTLTRYSSGSYAGITLEGEGTSVLLFKSASQMTSWNFVVDGNASPVTIYNHQLGGTGKTNWDDVCSSAAANIIYFVNSWGWNTPIQISTNNGSTWTDMEDTGLRSCTEAEIYSFDYADATQLKFREYNNSSNSTGNIASIQGPVYNPHPFDNIGGRFYTTDNIYCLGGFNNWEEIDANKFSAWQNTATTVTYTATNLTANTPYEFKIMRKYSDSNKEWFGKLGATDQITSTNRSCRFINSGGDNFSIRTQYAGDYTFTYDLMTSCLTVTYPPQVGCTGSIGTSNANEPRVSYTFTYIGDNIIVKAVPSTGTFTSCNFQYCNNTSGSGLISTPMELNDARTEATLVVPATGSYTPNSTMRFGFIYRAGTMSGEGNTSTSGWGNAPTYTVGNCILDDGEPYMLSATLASKTATSVTLNVSGKVNVDGVAQETTQYRVSVDGGAYETYTATAGQITIDGLTHSTQYTFTVKAYYEGNESENVKTVTAATNRESNCGPVTWYQDNTTNYPIEFELKYDEGSGDLTIEATSQTAYKLDYFEALSSLWTGGKLATIDGNGKATVTIPAAQLADPGTVGGIRFVYSMTYFGGNVQTAGNNDIQWPAVIYYVVGECGSSSAQEEPQMLSAETTEIGQETVEIHLTSRDNKTSAANMKYHINVRSTSGYETEWDLELTGQASGEYTLRGLVPNTGYTVTVYCEDGDGYLSTAAINTAEKQRKTFSFTTSNGNGCEWTSGESTIAVDGGPAWVPLPEGMSYILKVKKYDDTHITIEIDIFYNAATVSLGNCLLERWDGGLLEAYLTIDRDYVQEFTDESGHRYIRAVVGADLKDPSFAAFWGADGWTSDNNFAVKIEWGYVNSSTGGPSAAGYYIINPKNIVDGTDCRGSFVITQQGRTPATITLPAANEGTITFENQILYYRQFTPGQWEPICFPFEVSSVEVYDPDDNSMYALTPQKSGGVKGKYLLRQQVANVSGEDFKSSWYDGSDNVPQKNTAYNIYFPSNGGWGPFFTKKFVLFRGTAVTQTVAANFTLGTAPTSDNQYTLYGNNTLSAQTLTKAYKETSDGTLYEMQNNWSLQPFECYVLASSNTMKVMRRIGPWPKDVPTGVENIWAETECLQKATVYNTLGQLMIVEHNILCYDLVQRCMTLPSGCYVIISEQGTKKILVP